MSKHKRHRHLHRLVRARFVDLPVDEKSLFDLSIRSVIHVAEVEMACL
jgi:hypothetical protein